MSISFSCGIEVRYFTLEFAWLKWSRLMSSKHTENHYLNITLMWNKLRTIDINYLVPTLKTKKQPIILQEQNINITLNSYTFVHKYCLITGVWSQTIQKSWNKAQKRGNFWYVFTYIIDISKLKLFDKKLITPYIL